MYATTSLTHDYWIRRVREGDVVLLRPPCRHHVCAFTALARAGRGGPVVVESGGRTTRYRITSTSSDFPKSGPGSLADRTTGVADRSVRNRLVLVTCDYDGGDVSLSNFVVVGTR
jgi:hypothetical protein